LFVDGFISCGPLSADFISGSLASLVLVPILSTGGVWTAHWLDAAKAG